MLFNYKPLDGADPFDIEFDSVALNEKHKFDFFLMAEKLLHLLNSTFNWDLSLVLVSFISFIFCKHSFSRYSYV